MNKLIAIISAFIAILTLASTAEAGFKVRLGFGGPLPVFNAYGNSGGYAPKTYKKRAYRAVRREKPAVQAKKSVAKAETEETVETAAAKPVQTENSSISVPAETASDSESAEPVETAAVSSSEPETAGKIDCKQFFPSVGMTLSVPCE